MSDTIEAHIKIRHSSKQEEPTWKGTWTHRKDGMRTDTRTLGLPPSPCLKGQMWQTCDRRECPCVSLRGRQDGSDPLPSLGAFSGTQPGGALCAGGLLPLVAVVHPGRAQRTRQLVLRVRVVFNQLGHGRELQLTFLKQKRDVYAQDPPFLLNEEKKLYNIKKNISMLIKLEIDRIFIIF